MYGAIVRSKANWIEWGEKPSSFFINLEKRAALDKCISSLIDDDGKRIDEQNSIMNMSYDFYKRLYSSHHVSDDTLVMIV